MSFRHLLWRFSRLTTTPRVSNDEHVVSLLSVLTFTILEPFLFFLTIPCKFFRACKARISCETTILRTWFNFSLSIQCFPQPELFFFRGYAPKNTSTREREHALKTHHFTSQNAKLSEPAGSSQIVKSVNSSMLRICSSMFNVILFPFYTKQTVRSSM